MADKKPAVRIVRPVGNPQARSAPTTEGKYRFAGPITRPPSFSNKLCGPCNCLLGDGRDFGYPRRLILDEDRHDMRMPTVEELKTQDTLHHPTFEAFCASANDGCHVCILLLAQKSKEEREAMLKINSEGRSNLFHYHRLAWLKYPPYEIQVKYQASEEMIQRRNDGTMILNLRSKRTNGRVCRLRKWNKPPEGTEWDIIANWVTKCLEEHKNCRSTKDFPDEERPARLIYVGEESDFSDIRLETTVDPKEKYMTLSHCWGIKGPPLTLLRSNIESLQKRIPCDDLPKTFKDAVVAVRNLSKVLNVKYLWIDALCIIQDSEEDMLKEIVLMSSIYSQSVLNLAAGLGSNGDSGLMQSFDRLRAHDCMVEASPSKQLGKWIEVTNFDAYEHLVKKGILNSRAWVLQEVVLAPRVVFFTPQQLIWECCESIFYQTSPNLDQWDVVPGNFKSFPLAKILDSDEPDLYLINQFWWQTVQNFSERRLTFEMDKLLAISAIARQMGLLPELKDNYVLGMWKHTFRHDIVWISTNVTRTYESSKDTKSKWPSWSWLSSESVASPTIMTRLKRTKGHATLTPSVEYAPGRDCFSDFASAELSVEGYIFKIDMEVKSKNSVAVFTDVSRLWVPESNGGKRYLIEDHGPLDFLFGKDKDSDVFDMEVYAVIMTETMYNNDEDDDLMLGLLLLRAESGRGTYRRIGTFSASNEERDGIWAQALNHDGLSEDDYLAKTDKGQYKITIL